MEEEFVSVNLPIWQDREIRFDVPERFSNDREADQSIKSLKESSPFYISLL